MSTPNSLPSKRPTIQDVAVAAGVSRGTVSRALNGGRWVSPEAQLAVEAAVSKTGYKANAHARGLKLQRAGTVAFLIGEEPDKLFYNPNFAVLMRGVHNHLAERGITMILLLAGTPKEQKQALEFIAGGQIDGVVIVAWHGDPSMLSQLRASGVPTMHRGWPEASMSVSGYVATDDYDGGFQMTRHLLETGRQRIAMIAGPKETDGKLRVAGYQAALNDRYDPRLVVHSDYTLSGGAASIKLLLDSHPTIDAVFAANDLMAAGAVQQLLAQGKRVPEDIAVGGFDDSAAATNSQPQITTMRQPFDRICREMVRLLLEQINGQPAAQLILRSELVIREST